MKRKTIVRRTIALTALGLLILLLATRKTDRAHVKEMHRRITDAIAFVNENQDLLDMLQDIMERTNSSFENSGIEIMFYSFYPNYGEEKRLRTTVAYNPGVIAQTVHEGDRFDIFSSEEKERINQAANLLNISVSDYSIEICYANSGRARLNLIHPLSNALGAEKRDEQNYWHYMYNVEDYSEYWYFEIIDDNWVIEIYNPGRR